MIGYKHKDEIKEKYGGEITSRFWHYFFTLPSTTIGPLMNGRKFNLIHHYHNGMYDNTQGGGVGSDPGPPCTGERLCRYIGSNLFDFGYRRPGRDWNDVFERVGNSIVLNQLTTSAPDTLNAGNNWRFHGHIDIVRPYPVVDSSFAPLINAWMASQATSNNKMQCCAELNQLDAHDRAICQQSDYQITTQGPTLKCDAAMTKFCQEDPENKVCGCSDTAPYDNTSSEGQLYDYYKEKPNSGLDGSALKPCLLPECNNSVAYLWGNQYSKNCPQICAIINNMTVGDYANLDANDMDFNLSCGGQSVSVQNVPCKRSDLNQMLPGVEIMCEDEEQGFIAAGTSCTVFPASGQKCSATSLYCKDGVLKNVPQCNTEPIEGVEYEYLENPDKTLGCADGVCLLNDSNGDQFGCSYAPVKTTPIVEEGVTESENEEVVEGMEVEQQQCYWTSLEQAKRECSRWGACQGFSMDSDGNFYARGTSTPLEDSPGGMVYLKGAQAPEPPPPPSDDGEPVEPKEPGIGDSSSGMGIMGVIIPIVILAVLGVAIYFLFFRKKGNSDTVETEVVEGDSAPPTYEEALIEKNDVDPEASFRF